MTKQIRLDFSGGVNVIADKSVLPDKFGTVMDNIDVRSGFPRCFKEPIFNQIVANTDTTKIFNFRGRWIYSDNWRDYVADFINGIERIYWTESINSVGYDGDGDLAPQKMIEGTEVPLGTSRPETEPIVSSGGNIVPTINQITLIDSGSLITGTYFYAVSATFDSGTTAPSNIRSIEIPASVTKDIKIQWTRVENATGYIVWGNKVNDYSQLKEMVRLDGSNLTWTDNGSITPKGDNANQYFDNSPVSYVYTYERDVNSVTNESGLSPISKTISTSSGRNIARNFLNDGYFSQDSTISISDEDGYAFTVEPRPSTVDTFPYYLNSDVVSFESNSRLNQVLFTTLTAHRLTTDDYIQFTGAGWLNPNYKDQKYQVIVINATQFAILNIPEPTDSITGSLTTSGLYLNNPSDNYAIGNLTPYPVVGGSGTGATIEFTFSNIQYGVSSIESFNVAAGGSNYKVGDEVTVALPAIIGGGPSESLAIGLVLAGDITNSGLGYPTGGSIVTINLTSPSQGFSPISTSYSDVPLTGGSGTGATADFTIDGFGSITLVSIFNGGTGYVIGDTPSIDFALASPAITPGTGGNLVVTKVENDNEFTVSITGGSGTGAVGTAIVAPNSSIQSLYITNGGVGYLSSDTGLGITLGTPSTPFQFNAQVDNTIVNAQFDVTKVVGNNQISIYKTRISILPAPSDLNNGDAVYLNLSDSSSGRISRTSITNAGSGYTNGTYTNVPLVISYSNVGSGNGATANIVVTNNIISDFTISDGGVGYVVDDFVTVDPADLGNTGTGLTIKVTSVAGANTIQGLYKIYTTDLDGNPVPEGSFDVDALTLDWTAPTALGASAQWVPFNGYYRYWNLYRTGAAGAFQLVDQIDIYTSNYLDKTSTEYLGTTPSSYYTDNGIFGPVQVDFMPPPLGLQSLTSHYGMLFGVDGQRVKWTPIGQPDAWPDVFYYDFTYKPLALSSFGTGIIVLCEDAVYRIDGNRPSEMSLSKTNANEGCIAPYTVQKTNKGLIYLSKRGLMIFNGMDAQCITDNRIPSNMLLGPSKLENPVDFWWMPTKLGYFYGNFAFNDGVYFTDESANRFYQTNPIPSAIYDIKSFYHNGRYYLVYTTSDFYSAHTTLCVDLQIEGFPITTLGLKPIDVIVNELDDAYALFGNQGNGDLTNLSTFKAQNSEAEPFVTEETYTVPSSPYVVTVINSTTYVSNQSVYNSTDSVLMTEVASSPSTNEYMVTNGVYTFGSANQGKQIIITYQFAFATNAGLSVWKLFNGKGNMPLVIRSGQKGFGNTTERRKYEHLEFYGNGTLYARCYIDGNWIADDIVSLTELPSKARKFNLPKGQRLGYNLDFEAYGDTNRLVVEYGYAEMESPS